MRYKYFLLSAFFISQLIAPISGMMPASASTKGRCLLTASKKKQISVLKCSRLGGKKKLACVKKALATYNKAIKTC